MPSSTPQSSANRGVRFGSNSDNTPNQALMDAAGRDQAQLQPPPPQQQQSLHRRTVSDASPFSPAYSLAATVRQEDLDRARFSQSDNVGPLDHSEPDHAGDQDSNVDPFDREDDAQHSRSIQSRRITSGHIASHANDEEDENAYGGIVDSYRHSYPTSRVTPSRVVSQPPGTGRVLLPTRPEPTFAASPLRSLGMGGPPSRTGRAHSTFSPQVRQHVSASWDSSATADSHVQHYDPMSSPSMVQPYSPKIPFSPQVTASGSIRSSVLKPAISRRDRSIEDFRVEDAGDSLERGTVRKSEASDLRNASGSVVGTITGLFHAANSRDDSEPGHGFKYGHHRGSDDTLANDDLDDYYKIDDGKEPACRPPPIGRSHSEHRQSMAFIRGDDEGLLDDDDPALTGAVRKSMDAKRARQFMHRRSSWSSETGDPTMPNVRQRRRSSADAASISSEDARIQKYSRARTNFNRGKSATTIQLHVEAVMQRQKFILKLAKALMFFGAPSHRIESQLNATASVLEVDAQFIHFPGLVIASFGDIDKRTSETHFVKSSSSLTLGLLQEVHSVYRKVMHDEIGVAEGIKELDAMLKARPCYAIWQRVLLAAASCFIIAPLSFGGSLVDACIAAIYGAGLVFLKLHAARKNDMYSNVFEISMAILISFVSRALSTTNFFCYQSIASSGVILVLPGYVILCGSLELASKNMIAGSVRMVYAIIYSLFLGFGIAIGSDLYFMLDPKARQALWVPLDDATSVSGSFSMANSTEPLWTGSFTFTNGTSNSLNTGSIICERQPEWPWYRQAVTPWLQFLFVPLFSLLSCMNNLQPLRSRHLPVMVIIACVGFAANKTAKMYIFNRSDVVSAIGSFVIGILGNAYSRIFRGTAFTAMAVAVLFLVPSGMAMAGGLAMTYKDSDGDLYSNGLSIGMRMVQVAIGITVGLFGSGLVVYSFGRRKGAALFAF